MKNLILIIIAFTFLTSCRNEEKLTEGNILLNVEPQINALELYPDEKQYLYPIDTTGNGKVDIYAKSRNYFIEVKIMETYIESIWAKDYDPRGLLVLVAGKYDKEKKEIAWQTYGVR